MLETPPDSSLWAPQPGNTVSAHLHLIVNHLPVLGPLLAVPVILLAWSRQDRGVWSAAVLLLLLSGVGALAATWTGEPAEEQVEHLAGTSEAALERHEDRALPATIATTTTAVVALGTLALRVPVSAASPVVLVLTLLSAGAMGWTAQAGGQIRHPELRDTTAPLAELSHDADHDD